MASKRVVVTGLGVVSCFGNETSPFFESLLEGKSGVSKITSFDASSFPTQIAAEIKDFDAGDYLDKKQARRVDKFIAYTVVGGKKALESAGLSRSQFDSLNKQRSGVIIGSGMGGMERYVEGVTSLNEKGWKRVSPFFIPYVITNMGSGMLAMELGFMGPNYSISTACATGNHCIIAAAEHIRKGEADLMLAGGAEAAIVPIGLAGFCACKALSERNDDPTKASRPWDKGRDGFVMGEGAGVLVLESLEHALKRGATIYAEYLGGGMSSDAYHITDPKPDGQGVQICIKAALDNAKINESQVDYINAHGTSTPVGDMAEVSALKKVFKNPQKIIMNSTKGLLGHALGAAGGIEAIVSVLSINQQKIHPMPNLIDPEPNIDFILPTKAMSAPINVALSNSFGFGGHNASILFGKYI